MLKLTTRTGNEIWKFESVSQYNGSIDRSFTDRIDFSDESFLGRSFYSFADVEKALNEAWEQGIAVVEDFLLKLQEIQFPPIKEVKARKVWNGTEGEIDFERLMAGNPEYMMNVHREKSEGPTTITIVADLSGHSGVEARDMLWRGAAAIALTKILEEKGYQVELWAIKGSKFYANHPDRTIFQTLNLKRPGDPLDLSTLIGAVSAWFYRTETFLMAYTIAHRENHSVKFGLGKVVSADQNDLDLVTTDQKRIYVSGVFSFDGACSLIEAELRRIAEEE